MAILVRDGSLKAANDEIHRARQQAARRQLRESRIRARLAVTDTALGRLEELNLQGLGATHPEGSARRAVREAVAELPERARRRVRAGTVQQALDSLLEAQEALLREQHGLVAPDLSESLDRGGSSRC